MLSSSLPTSLLFSLLMASVRVAIFLFALIVLRFFKYQGGVVDGRSYPVSTQVGRETERDQIVRKMGRIIVKEQDGHHSSPSTIDSFDNLYQGKNENLNVTYRLISKRDDSHGGHLLGGKGSRFIAFNADYFVAKPHPPKNNGGKCL